MVKARNLINSILDRYDADFVGFLNFVDWFSIEEDLADFAGFFETKPPISIMLGSRVGNDLALLDIVQEFSEVAKPLNILTIKQ